MIRRTTTAMESERFSLRAKELFSSHFQCVFWTEVEREVAQRQTVKGQAGNKQVEADRRTGNGRG
jgi:hypothetical protein